MMFVHHCYAGRPVKVGQVKKEESVIKSRTEVEIEFTK